MQEKKKKGWDDIQGGKKNKGEAKDIRLADSPKNKNKKGGGKERADCPPRKGWETTKNRLQGGPQKRTLQVGGIQEKRGGGIGWTDDSPHREKKEPASKRAVKDAKKEKKKEQQKAVWQGEGVKKITGGDHRRKKKGVRKKSGAQGCALRQGYKTTGKSRPSKMQKKKKKGGDRGAAVGGESRELKRSNRLSKKKGFSASKENLCAKKKAEAF